MHRATSARVVALGANTHGRDLTGTTLKVRPHPGVTLKSAHLAGEPLCVKETYRRDHGVFEGLHVFLAS